MRPSLLRSALLLILLLAAQWYPLVAQNKKHESKDQILHYIAKVKEKFDAGKDQDSVLYFLTAAEKLAIESEADSLLFEIRDSQAFWHTEQLAYDQAKRLLKVNQVYADSIDSPSLQMRTQMNFALMFEKHRLENPDSVLYYLRQALALAEAIPDTFHILLCQISMGAAMLLIPEKLDSAEILLHNALTLTNEGPEAPYFAATCHFSLGTFYQKKLQPQKAIEQVKKGLAIAKDNESNGWLMMGYQQLAALYEQQQQYELALDAFKEYSGLSHLVEEQKRKEKVEQLETELEVERKEAKINQLEALTQQQKTYANQQNGLLLVAVLSLILVSLSAIFAYRNYRRRLEANRELLQTQQEAALFQSRFYTNITHEFRTPLTVISGMAEQLEDLKAKQLIHRNSDQLLQLINQMLDQARLDSGLLEAEMIQADIVAYTEYLVESFRSLADQKNIQLHFHAEPEIIQMDFDPEKIKHIIANLLSNAIKFTPERGKIFFSAQQKDQDLELMIRDTGIGIPQEDQSRIFDRYFRSKTHPKVGGSGIGLSFVQELVQLMKGEVFVESRLDKGSKFIVSLPIAQVAAVSELNIPDKELKDLQAEEPAPSTSDISILVIEDNADVSYYIRQCLQSDYQVFQAYDGEEGIRMALEHVPDLIISDVMMPRMDGFEVCQELKSNRITSHIPIVMLTAKSTEEEKLAGLSHGADAYLVKPFHKEELLIRVRNLADLQEKWREKFQAGLDIPGEKEKTEVDPFLKEAREIVLSHLSDADYSVEPLCRDLGISRTQLHRKLKNLTGISTKQFINDIRLTEAKKLLQEGKLNVSEVAYATGFAWPNYFSKLYQEKFGQSPGETRI